MKNVDVKQNGNTLTIKIDLRKSSGISKSGKSEIVATTSGNARVGELDGKPLTLGLNLYTPVE